MLRGCLWTGWGIVGLLSEWRRHFTFRVRCIPHFFHWTEQRRPFSWSSDSTHGLHTDLSKTIFRTKDHCHHTSLEATDHSVATPFINTLTSIYSVHVMAEKLALTMVDGYQSILCMNTRAASGMDVLAATRQPDAKTLGTVPSYSVSSCSITATFWLNQVVIQWEFDFHQEQKDRVGLTAFFTTLHGPHAYMPWIPEVASLKDERMPPSCSTKPIQIKLFNM